VTRAEKTAYWRPHIEGLRQSGLSMRAYAKRAGVTVSGLKYWRKHLADAATGPRVSDSNPFLPVILKSAAPSELAAVEIVLVSGRRLRLTGPVEAQWLSTLVQLLETPCC
jgi:hypothetical protein